MKKNKYLLDINICIALLRGNRGIAQKLISIGEGNCFLSIITLYELTFGAYYSKQEDSVEEYAIIKTQLRSSGILIDEFDLLIAATALSGDYVLVTDNVKHFQRITDLKIENWTKR